MLCQWLTRTGKPCKNGPVMTARPQYATGDHSDVEVCGVHSNELWQAGWQVWHKADARWARRPGATPGGER